MFFDRMALQWEVPAFYETVKLSCIFIFHVLGEKANLFKDALGLGLFSFTVM